MEEKIWGQRENKKKKLRLQKGLLEISSLSWYLESKSDNLLEVLKESFIFHTPLGSWFEIVC